MYLNWLRNDDPLNLAVGVAATTNKPLQANDTVFFTDWVTQNLNGWVANPPPQDVMLSFFMKRIAAQSDDLTVPADVITVQCRYQVI